MRFFSAFVTACVFVCLLANCGAQQPQTAPIDTQPETPPGTQPAPLVAPTIIKPNEPSDDVGPTPDDLKTKPGIVVTIGGEIIETPVVAVQVGQLVEFSPQGAADETLVRWNYSSSIRYKTTRDRGHYVAATFTPDDVGRVILVGAVWNGDAAGYAFGPMRWVIVSGHAPQPPPDVVPPKPPTPVPPGPITTGSKRIIVIRESLEPSPEMGRLIVLMQSGPIGDYMKSKGHKFESFDKDAKDENDKPSAYVKKWLDAIGTIELPAAAIVDIATETIDVVKPLGKSPTAQALLDLAKEHGG